MPTNRTMLVKRAIIDALDSLLQERDFEQVSVQDICERAQVSRTTFYRHFKDKFHVVNWTYENYKDILNKRGPENEAYQLSLSYLLGFMREKRDFFLCALKYTGQNSLSEYMVEIGTACMTNTYAAHVEPKKISESDRRMVLYNAAGASEIMRNWLIGGCQDEPADLVDDITSNMSEDLKAALAIRPDWRTQAEAAGKKPGRPWY